MARAGDVLENPVTGERFVFLKTAAETDGEVLEFEVFVRRPRGFGTQPHLHRRQEERHEVVSGAVGLTVGDRERILGAGDVEVVPAKTPHRVWAANDDEVHMRFEVRPALRSERLIETLVGLGRDGKMNEKGFPSPLQLAVIGSEFREEGHATRPPLAVQRLLFAPLAALGRRRGYRGIYPQYSE